MSLRELRAKDIAPFVDIAAYHQQYHAVRLFYTAIDYRVSHEDKYHYNGTNYRLMIVVREQDSWRLAQMSEAPVEAIVAAGNGFGTSEEGAAITVRTARMTGKIINAQGKHLGTNAADRDEERRRRGNQPLPPDGSPATEATPVPPAIIYVRTMASRSTVPARCISRATPSPRTSRWPIRCSQPARASPMR